MRFGEVDITNHRADDAHRARGLQGIRFLELRLEGFGPYARATRFIFPPLLGLDVRPNEEGKSTVVHGIQAVIFGLPRSSDADEFGTERFLSWGGSHSFSGALDLLIDERRYRILRDFETHKTRIMALDSDDMVLYDGEANPKGHSSSIHSYREVLGGLIPVTESDLFRSVYCVEQPLPEESQVSHEVQRLLTGAGVAAGEGVLSVLFQRYRSLSRKTGEAGIHRPGRRPTDQHTDGRLEALEKRLDELETAVRDGEQHFARLREREDQVQRLSHDSGRVRDSRKDRQSALGKLNSYRDHALQWERLRQRRSELNRALETYNRHESERQEYADHLASAFPHLVDARPELNEQLESALESHELLQSARAEKVEIGKELNLIESDIEKLRGSLRGESDLAGRTEEFWPSLERRQSLWRQIQDTKAALEEIDQKKARIEEESPEDAPWNRLPKPPDLWIQSMAKKAGSFLERWKRWSDIDTRRRVFQSSMKRWEPLLGSAFESEDISSLEITRKEMARGVELAREQEKLHRERLEEAEKRHSWKRSRRRLLAFATSLSAGALVTVALLLLANPPLLAALALGVAIALIGYGTFGRAPSFDHDRLTLQSALREAEKETIHAEKSLQEFRSRWDSLLVALNLPSMDEGGLTELIAVRREHLDSVQKMESMRLLQEQLDRDLYGRILTEQDDVSEFELDSLPQEIQDLASFVAIMADKPPTDVKSLASWLSELDPWKWQEWESMAARWAEDRRKLSNYATVEDMHLGKGGTPGLPQFESELQRLEEICQPIPLDADLSEIEPRWRRVRRTEERLRILEARRDELADALKEAQAKGDEALGKWEPWEKSLKSHLEATVGDLHLLSGQWRETQQLRRKILEAERLRDGALAILEGIDNTLPGLNAALKLAEDQSDFHYRGMQELEKESDTVGHYVSLPSGDERDSYRRRLEEELGDLKSEEERLKKLLNEAQIDLRSLGRSDTPPLAQLELDIHETRQEIVKVESRRESILEAWRIMKEVVAELPETYRPPLAKSITQIFSGITAKTDRRVDLTPDLELSILEGGHPCSMEQLSQGARDQLSLAIRLAVAEQVGRNVPLPMLFDDPFVNFDAERIENLKQSLMDLAQERQILIWTHDERFAGWGEAMRRETI